MLCCWAAPGTVLRAVSLIGVKFALCRLQGCRVADESSQAIEGRAGAEPRARCRQRSGTRRRGRRGHSGAR